MWRLECTVQPSLQPPLMQYVVKCPLPLAQTKLWLQARGAQKCRGLIFYKSHLACIKIRVEFFIANGKEQVGWATKQSPAACIQTSPQLHPEKSKSPNETHHSNPPTISAVHGWPFRHRDVAQMNTSAEAWDAKISDFTIGDGDARHPLKAVLVKWRRQPWYTTNTPPRGTVG